MNFDPIFTGAWDEIFDDVVVATGSDEVFKNTANDLNLPPHFRFAGGRYIETQWWTVWTRMIPAVHEIVSRRACNGVVSCHRVIKWRDGSWHVMCTGDMGIGLVHLALTDEPPEKLQRFFDDEGGRK